MKYSKGRFNTMRSQINHHTLRLVIHQVLRTPYLRSIVIGIVVTAAALFFAARVAVAGLPDGPLSAIKSPIPTPVTVVLNCGDDWNPDCQTSAATTTGAKLYSFFYIDGRFRGPANQTYINVCQTFRLADGLHTARVFARDAQHNSANVGPYRVIHCDRHGPVLSTGLRSSWWLVSINPIASDRFSGVADMDLMIDGVTQTWGPYLDVCGTFGLTKGWHRVSLSATDNVGNASFLSRLFFCRTGAAAAAKH